MHDCPLSVPTPPSLVLAELQLANLVTGEECKGLIGPKYVVRVQRSKPAKVLAKTADVLGRHEFMKMSKFLAGKHTYVQ